MSQDQNSTQRTKNTFFQLRISTVLLLLVIVALVTNQVVSFRVYESKIDRLSNELQIFKLEKEVELQQRRYGPGHPSVKDLAKELDSLRNSHDEDANESN